MVVLERVNARHLAPELLPETLDIATVSMSFNWLALGLSAVARVVASGGNVVALVQR